MRSPAQFFLDTYVAFLQSRAEKKADKYRQMQAKTEREYAKVIRFDIFDDMLLDESVRKHVYTYTLFVKDGRVVRLDNNIKPDTVVHMDVPCVMGIHDGRLRVFNNGKWVIRENFKAKDAAAMGRMTWKGGGNLANLFLFDDTIWPEVEQDLRGPTASNRS